MCLAIPAKITELDGDDMAVVALEGIKKRVSTALVEDLAVGDYVLVHVGYALHKVSPDEAARTLQLMAEAGVLQDELDEMTGAGQ
ncbi:HypC/HybG/HupF family hydrogenase formation chaperone [Labrenzia sp. R4_1]|uniref:HypC/HybG/HupF family hydrogenase formation chaperone n=1 Tax=Labrenzia sp. R4_1 TaxID=2821106 RepID=UPI001ADA6B8A|nr:HypC/HybG/HupF family hydrogenase formation chaperone [Labrenzia sp. R4_1]MBO9424182.1 HypC/HybG/HupF family hydrogenase formation chaperone [Labrenzia sp. R4_1]